MKSLSSSLSASIKPTTSSALSLHLSARIHPNLPLMAPTQRPTYNRARKVWSLACILSLARKGRFPPRQSRCESNATKSQRTFMQENCLVSRPNVTVTSARMITRTTKWDNYRALPSRKTAISPVANRQSLSVTLPICRFADKPHCLSTD
jgi:hypothetical protein